MDRSVNEALRRETLVEEGRKEGVSHLSLARTSFVPSGFE